MNVDLVVNPAQKEMNVMSVTPCSTRLNQVSVYLSVELMTAV